VELQRHPLRLLEQELHHHVERDVAAPSDAVDALLPTLKVVVRSDVSLVDREGRRRPHGTGKPRRLHVLEQVTDGWRRVQPL